MDDFNEQCEFGRSDGYQLSEADHFTPAGWESEVLDGVRTFAAVRRGKLKLRWLPTKKRESRSLMWIFGHEVDPDAVQLEGHDLWRINYTATPLAQSTPSLIPMLEVVGNIHSGDQYSFLFWDKSEQNLYQKQEFFADKFAGKSRFRPSKELFSIWAESISAYINNSKSRSDIEAHTNNSKNDELFDDFVSKFQRMIATIANSQRKGSSTVSEISDGQQFLLDFQHEVVDRFFIVPQKQSSFLYLLHGELKDYLEQAGRLSGKWGELVVSNGIISFICLPNQAAKLPPL